MIKYLQPYAAVVVEHSCWWIVLCYTNITDALGASRRQPLAGTKDD